MKLRHIIFVLVCVLLWFPASAKRHKSYLAESEGELMQKVLNCLKNKDSLRYYSLFMPFDTLWNMVLQNSASSPQLAEEMKNLRTHPTILIDMDPFYNPAIMGRFSSVVRKGADSGLQWGGIVMQRYEVQKQGIARGTEGIEHIMPERFRGFLFVRDMYSSTTWCITIAEIQKIGSYFFGGQVINVLEAGDVDAYMHREEAERRYLAELRKKALHPQPDTVASDTSKLAPSADSAMLDTSITNAEGQVDSAKWRKSLLKTPAGTEDEGAKMRLEVIDRKYYKGKFDDEIDVELYVRYMRDGNGKVTHWDALYKFGDMPRYVKLDVSKTKEGQWLFEEPVAVMELDLADKTYTGSWTNGASLTGYDVDLKQVGLPADKSLEMDYILENHAWAPSSEQPFLDDEKGKKGRGRNRKKNRSDEDAKPKAKAKKDEDEEE